MDRQSIDKLHFLLMLYLLNWSPVFIAFLFVFSCVSFPSLSLSGLHFVCICIENHSLGALVVNKSSVKINYKLPISCHKELIKIKTSEE